MVSSRPGRQRVDCNSAVLCAVYIPTTFIGGLQGSFYQQFSITIAPANVISVFVSLTLSPALAALLRKPHAHEPQSTLAHQLAALRCGDSSAGQLGLRVAVIRPWRAGEPIGDRRGSSAAQQSAAELVWRQP